MSHVRVSPRVFLACLLVAGAAAPGRLTAQQAPPSAGPNVGPDSLAPAQDVRAAPVERSLMLDPTGGRVAAARAESSAKVGADTRAALAQPERRVRAGRNVALMAVGAVGLVTGLIIGDSGGAFLAVGSAIVGLTGLYLYLR